MRITAALKSPHKAIRILTAVPICDGHDSAILTINLELVRHGIEVIYLGYNRSVREIVRAAIQEDARAVGLSSYNGGHLEFFSEVRAQLRQQGAGSIGLFGGGGGTITAADAKVMKRRGVDEIFFAGTPLSTMVEFVHRAYARQRRPPALSGSKKSASDLEIGRLLTAAESGLSFNALRFTTKSQPSALRASLKNPLPLLLRRRGSGRGGHFLTHRHALTVGLTGPGGAGKTTLIDELALRFISSRPSGRLAILSHDPSLPGKGALLGDRASMIYAQHDRVFMRSIATRGEHGGLSSATQRCLKILKAAGFDLIVLESAGIGQQDTPFSGNLAAKQVWVASPEYGGRLQLQKIGMLEAADIVVVNKADLPAAKTALAEIEQRLAMNGRGQKVIGTVAKRYGDPGVDKLFGELTGDGVSPALFSRPALRSAFDEGGLT